MNRSNEDQTQPDLAPRRAEIRLRSAEERRLAELLRGDLDVELPTTSDVASAATALASARKNKVLLPVGSAKVEYAFVRDRQDVLISSYDTGTLPTVHLLNRRVSLRSLIDACAEALFAFARSSRDEVEEQIAMRVAERAIRSEIVPALDIPKPINQRGGNLEPPEDGTPLSFGFAASILPNSREAQDRATRADLHALLFEGELWAYIHGRRVPLIKGPIMLAAHRMVSSVRALVEASERHRPLNIRLVSGNFHIGLRMTPKHGVALTLGSSAKQSTTAAGLSVEETALPILRLVSDLLRALTAADRSQSRNLVVHSLRQEVRELRKWICGRNQAQSFTNRDPDRIRLEPTISSAPPETEHSMASLRFAERWRIAIDGVDANATFLCGDRLVLATPDNLIAIARDSGDVMWARPSGNATTLMTADALIRVNADGEIELCHVNDGEPYARSRIQTRNTTNVQALAAGGGSRRPVAIVTEGLQQLVAIDLVTGELRWRFSSRFGGGFQLRRAGNVILVSCGEGALHALDPVTGEDVWRFTSPTRFHYRPALCDDVVIAASGSGYGAGTLYGLDLYSGELRWETSLQAGLAAEPYALGQIAMITTASEGNTLVKGFNAASGEEIWTISDPGIGIGGAALAIDRQLLINTPTGQLSSIRSDDGSLCWSVELADPIRDDLPRKLEPILRGGALFVPSSSVHVVRPADGRELEKAIPCDLVPDIIRVDERGWVYVGEEGGCVAAYAPVPHLTLIK